MIVDNKLSHYDKHASIFGFVKSNLYILDNLARIRVCISSFVIFVLNILKKTQNYRSCMITEYMRFNYS